MVKVTRPSKLKVLSFSKSVFIICSTSWLMTTNC